MKTLYKASFNTVIYAADSYDALVIARELADETAPFCFLEGTVEEVLSADDLPCNWRVGYNPVKCGSGYFADIKIKEILEENKATLALRQRIKELEAELAKLKEQIND